MTERKKTAKKPARKTTTQKKTEATSDETRLSILELYGKDVNAAKNGKWVELARSNGLISVKVIGDTEPEFIKDFQKLSEEFSTKLSKCQITDDDRKDLSKQQVSKKETEAQLILQEFYTRQSILRLRDWKGFYAEDGSEIAFSREKAEEILLNPIYSDLADDIYAVTENKDLFRLKNSVSRKKN